MRKTTLLQLLIGYGFILAMFETAMFVLFNAAFTL